MAKPPHLTFTLLVSDYDRALRFYRDLLGFELLFDTDFGGFRHIQLTCPGFQFVRVTLHQAHTVVQQQALGRQTGDAAWIVLPVRDCISEVERLRSAGVVFKGDAIELPYAIQATATDPDGNRVCLSQNFTTFDPE